MNQDEQKKLAAAISELSEAILEIPLWKDRYIVRAIVAKALSQKSDLADIEYALELTFAKEEEEENKQ